MNQGLKNDSTLALLLALVVVGRWPQLKNVLRKAAQSGIPTEQLREILLQAHLFAGFPRTIEAFEVFASVEAEGILPAKSVAREIEVDPKAWEKRGRELFQTIYASKTNEVLSRISGYHPDLESWILQHAYGRVLSRPLLSPRQRELAAVAALIVSRQWRQLMSHIRGAQRCGASTEQIEAVFQAVKPITPPATWAKARKIFQQS